MICSIKTIALEGIRAKIVDVQVNISAGMPAFVIVGLPDKSVNESKERIRAVLANLGVDFPSEHITVNLTPADVLKEGTHYDLPIALGLLGAMKIIPNDLLKEYIIMGALSLDGTVEPVRGVLSAAVEALAQKLKFVCPKENGEEAALVGTENVFPVHHILEFLNFIKERGVITPPKSDLKQSSHYTIDMDEVKGQESAKRAMLIAAAGGHNLLMIGPPGSGKTMLAERMVTILPPLTVREALETGMVHSVAGQLNGSISFDRPFRSPHHSASMPSLIGGGRVGTPGEISLAHNGVLFLDELPEFSRAALEALRQPLESKKAIISRVQSHVVYPANFQLIAAMNPCRCGHFGTKGHECAKAPDCAIAYLSKLSGPLLDRFDMQIEVPAVNPYELTSTEKGTSSKELLERVERAREIQKKRFKELGLKNIHLNSELKGDSLEKNLNLNDELREFIAKSSEKCGLTARSLTRILRLARTIADLQNEKNVSKLHVIEALSYRYRLSRKPC